MVDAADWVKHDRRSRPNQRFSTTSIQQTSTKPYERQFLLVVGGAKVNTMPKLWSVQIKLSWPRWGNFHVTWPEAFWPAPIWFQWMSQTVSYYADDTPCYRLRWGNTCQLLACLPQSTRPYLTKTGLMQNRLSERGWEMVWMTHKYVFHGMGGFKV